MDVVYQLQYLRQNHPLCPRSQAGAWECPTGGSASCQEAGFSQEAEPQEILFPDRA